MKTILDDLREIFRPEPGSPHGPVAPLLLGMSFVTGLVDAFSYLVLGHVFVANMTGNVLFLAFAFAGAHGLSIPASLVALLAFFVGAVSGGKNHTLMNNHRARLFTISSIVQSTLLLAALVLAVASSPPLEGSYLYALIVVLALAMGIQNAASRKLAVPDFTTTVLTMTIVDLGINSKFAGGSGSKGTRRLLAVLTIFLGALVGALFVLHVRDLYPVVIAFVIVSAVGLSSRALSKLHPEWH
ncbi:MAG: YoaK family protein [Acidimicrobiales bacterium]